MTKTIIENMEREQNAGNRELGEVSNTKLSEQITENNQENIITPQSIMKSTSQIEDLNIKNI